MNIFVNDYNDLAHEKVLEKLNIVNKKGNLGYGYDDYTKKAKELIKRDLKNENVEIEFLAGGTIANIIAVTANLFPYEGIIAANSGHINAHEAGSIEATGKKIETIYSKDGKIYADELELFLDKFSEEHTISPKIVYISQTTEMGTVYTYDEIKNIYDVCLEYGVYLYIDGARMAVGLAASDIEVSDLVNICDMFTLGGTKNGALYGEALVIVSDELKQNVRRYMKQRGATIAKGFVFGAQFIGLFEDGLYYELGKKSYEMSRYLADRLKEVDLDFYQEPESNQIFLLLDREWIDKLLKNNLFEIMDYNDEKKIIRLVTSYRTSKEEIDSLIEDIKR
ncbi:threonine aldolase family protein [Peptoniphilus obesi]|uniref:threonine aldolase family protein n=1 Tax=Peptoniphilus obesi TaxID=1472765 RepID=UPI0004AF2FC8|nr:aminotransferase class I/II-fold pyridoxal phosphate-dependent enzyme [Peptoniphilus obesi]